MKGERRRKGGEKRSGEHREGLSALITFRARFVLKELYATRGEEQMMQGRCRKLKTKTDVH